MYIGGGGYVYVYVYVYMYVYAYTCIYLVISECIHQNRPKKTTNSKWISQKKNFQNWTF